ncbi:MAG: hypothetical protein FWF56_06390 [Firmicutes bacterium]|nr:hypothetical protein [Bacillota bacterium]MCL1953858.1 hypothetical protein [Bacillota bacterium]
MMSNFDNRNGFGVPISPSSQNIGGYHDYGIGQGGGFDEQQSSNNTPVDLRMGGAGPASYGQQSGYGVIPPTPTPPIHPGMPIGLPNMGNGIRNNNPMIPNNHAPVSHNNPMMPSNHAPMLPSSHTPMSHNNMGFGGRMPINPNSFNNSNNHNNNRHNNYRDMSSNESEGSSLYMILVGIMAVFGLVGAFVSGFFIGSSSAKNASTNNIELSHNNAIVTTNIGNSSHHKSLQDCLNDFGMKLN